MAIFLIRTSLAATHCQDAQGRNGPKEGFLCIFFVNDKISLDKEFFFLLLGVIWTPFDYLSFCSSSNFSSLCLESNTKTIKSLNRPSWNLE